LWLSLLGAMVDQMIHSQLGGLTSSAPVGPSWEAKTEVADRLEEAKGKPEEELMPMYMEGRSVQAGGFNMAWLSNRWVAAGLAVVMLVAVMGLSMAGSQTPAGAEEPDAADASSALARAGPAPELSLSNTSFNSSIAAPVINPEREEPEVQKEPLNLSSNVTTNLGTNQAPEDQDLDSYRASCPTLLKLHSACDYDLAADDSSLQPRTFVRLVCPDECKVMDRYRKMCVSLLHMDGGCAHDLSIEEEALPRGTYVRLICPEKCETSTSSTTTKEPPTVAARTTAPPTAPVTTTFSVVTGPSPALRGGHAPLAQAEAELPSKVRPSRWLGYLVGLGTAAAWVGLCINERRAFAH